MASEATAKIPNKSLNQILPNLLATNLDNYKIYINRLHILRNDYGKKISEINKIVSSVYENLNVNADSYLRNYEKTKGKYKRLLIKKEINNTHDISAELEYLSKESSNLNHSLELLNHLENEIDCLKKARQSELFKSLSKRKDDFKSFFINEKVRNLLTNKNVNLKMINNKKFNNQCVDVSLSGMNLSKKKVKINSNKLKKLKFVFDDAKSIVNKSIIQHTSQVLNDIQNPSNFYFKKKYKKNDILPPPQNSQACEDFGKIQDQNLTRNILMLKSKRSRADSNSHQKTFFNNKNVKKIIISNCNNNNTHIVLPDNQTSLGNEEIISNYVKNKYIFYFLNLIIFLIIKNFNKKIFTNELVNLSAVLLKTLFIYIVYVSYKVEFEYNAFIG